MYQRRMQLACLAVLISSPAVAAAGLRIRDAAAPAAAPAASPGASPGPASASALAPIRPGVAVRITKSKEELLNSFKGSKIRYSPLMDQMLGKDFVVKSMGYGGAGLAAADGTQGDTWYFPLPSLTPWTATDDARTPPVPEQASKVVGLPTHSRVEIGPPGRHDAPWDFTIKGGHLLDPIAPSHSQQVDLQNSAMHMPPWTKVKQVVSIDCMDKLHKDPTHLCDPDAYLDYNAVTPKPTVDKLTTQADAKKLRAKIKRLEGIVNTLSPKKKKIPEEPKQLVFKAPAVKETKETMNTMNAVTMGAVQESKKGSAGKEMKIHTQTSVKTLPVAEVYDETSIRVRYDHPI